MSLINQMLKDLEQRRAESLDAPDSPFKSVPRYEVVKAHPQKTLYILLSFIIALLFALLILLWPRIQFDPQSLTNVLQPESTEKPVVDEHAAELAKNIKSNNELPEKTIAQSEPALLDSTAQIQTGQQSSLAPDAKKDVKTPVKLPQKKLVPEVNHTSATDEEEVEAGKLVEKYARQLTPEQQAEIEYQKGHQALRLGRINQGESHLKNALQASLQHSKSREMLVGIYIKAGRYVEAGQLLQAGIVASPQHTLFYKLYARVLLEQDNLYGAVKVLERRLPPATSDSDYHALLAALYQRQAKHTQAAALYQNLLTLNPSVGVWWIGLGISLEKIGKQEAAREAYKQARSSGNLANTLSKFSDNRLAALQDLGYSEE